MPDMNGCIVCLLASATKQLASEALELFCQEVRKCREEDEKNSEEDPEWREYEDKNRRTSQFRDECRRKWKEQG